MNLKLIKKIKTTDIFETLKHSKNYFIANIAIKSLGFISIPIFTRLFTRADYGLVAVFSSYAGIITVVLSLNSYASVGRYYYEEKNDFGEFLGSALSFLGLIFLLTIPIYILFYKQIGSLMKLPGLLPIYLIFVSLFAILTSIYMQIMVPQRKSREVARINILKSYTGFGVAVLLVYLLKENRYLGQIWATLLVGFIFSIYFIMVITKYSKLSFKVEHIKYILSFSVPLIPYALSGIILAQFDRIMINTTMGAEDAGLYSLAYNIGMLLTLVISSTQIALMPDFFKFMNHKEYNRLDLLIKKVFSIIAISALGLVLFAKEIMIILADEKFHSALNVIPVVIVGYVFYGMFTVYGRYIGYEKKTIYSSIVALTAGISNIILNAMFIPKYGYIAAAYTTVASYFIMFLMAWIVAKIILKQHVTPLWVLWKPILIMFIFIGFVVFLNRFNLNVFLFFGIKLLALLLFSSIVFYKEIKIILNLSGKI